MTAKDELRQYMNLLENTVETSNSSLSSLIHNIVNGNRMMGFDPSKIELRTTQNPGELILKYNDTEIAFMVTGINNLTRGVDYHDDHDLELMTAHGSDNLNFSPSTPPHHR